MKRKTPILLAVTAAACYGVGAPFSKLLLNQLPPTLIASLLYLGAGLGMLIIHLFKNNNGFLNETRISKNELPYVFGMVLLDIAAPVALMLGLSMSAPANAALLNNFEIAATSLVAFLVFKEAVGKRMWLAILLITISSLLLSFEDITSLSFSVGSVLIIIACVCWGFENNCTRMLSLKNPLQIVVIKGLGSGFGSLIIAAALKEYSLNLIYILCGLLLGFFAYGMSVYYYILAQRELGAARTSAYYAVSPFIGVIISFVFFAQPIKPTFILALLIMIPGAYFAAVEKHKHTHIHAETEHEHRHNHSDGHHNHCHDYPVTEHCHPHKHERLVHEHRHTPDMHHIHSH